MFEGCSLDVVDPKYQPWLVSNPSEWLHTPPSQMPWSIPVANQPAVVRFTGDSNSGAMPATRGADDSNSFRPRHIPCASLFKRKSCEDGFDFVLPNKQLITEEKMAANLNGLHGLHISSNYTSHQFGASMEDDIPAATSQTERNTVSGSEVGNNMPSLVVLCEELRKLTAEPVIPTALMNKIERPSTALVLWQPPGGNICQQLRSAVERQASKSTKESSTSRNQTEEDPKPSTSGLNQKQLGNQQKKWFTEADNNNLATIMDLNLFPTESQGTPSEQDDTMMDL